MIIITRKFRMRTKRLFFTLSGGGIVCLGISLLITAVILGVTDSVWSFWVFGIGFVAGLALLIFSELKYNRR